MKVSQLYGSRRLLNDVRGLGQSPGGPHLPVSSDHLGPGGPPSLRLGRHRPLELRGQPRVLTEVTQSDGRRAMYGVCELLAPISQAFKNDVDFLHFVASPVLQLFGEISKVILSVGCGATHISTLSTRIPQGLVASSRSSCKMSSDISDTPLLPPACCWRCSPSD